MSGKMKSWILERVPIDVDRTSHIMEMIFLKEPIPKHMKYWYYALGATPIILFLMQIVTGVLLTSYFVPSTEGAYESVRKITYEVDMGFWIRGLHRWGSNLMVITLMLHMVRVYFTRGYRKPRELNWVLGILIFFTTLTLCFTGYSLIYDQLSYWATTVGTNMIKEMPIIGTPLLELMRGGAEVTGTTLTRFFVLHIGVLPIALIILLFIHIFIVRLHGVSNLEGSDPDEKTYPFYPEHFYYTLVLTLFLLTFMSALTVILPTGLGDPANPAITPQHIKPEWYFFGVYSILKFVPLKLGIYMFMAFILVAAFWPFIDGKIREKMPNFKVHYWFGSLCIALFLIFTLYEIFVH